MVRFITAWIRSDILWHSVIRSPGSSHSLQVCIDTSYFVFLPESQEPMVRPRQKQLHRQNFQITFTSGRRFVAMFHHGTKKPANITQVVRNCFHIPWTQLKLFLIPFPLDQITLERGIWVVRIIWPPFQNPAHPPYLVHQRAEPLQVIVIISTLLSYSFCADSEIYYQSPGCQWWLADLT